MYIVNTLSHPRATDPFDPTDITVKAPPLNMLYVTPLSFDIPSFNGKIEDLASHLNQQVPFTKEILPHTDVFPVLGSVPVYPTDPTVSAVVSGAGVTTYKPVGTGQQEYNIEDNQSLATVGHERVRSFRQVFVKPVRFVYNAESRCIETYGRQQLHSLENIVCWGNKSTYKIQPGSKWILLTLENQLAMQPADILRSSNTVQWNQTESLTNNLLLSNNTVTNREIAPIIVSSSATTGATLCTITQSTQVHNQL